MVERFIAVVMETTIALSNNNETEPCPSTFGNMFVWTKWSTLVLMCLLCTYIPFSSVT
jgi:hypothetical protein